MLGNVSWVLYNYPILREKVRGNRVNERWWLDASVSPTTGFPCKNRLRSDRLPVKWATHCMSNPIYNNHLHGVLPKTKPKMVISNVQRQSGIEVPEADLKRRRNAKVHCLFHFWTDSLLKSFTSLPVSVSFPLLPNNSSYANYSYLSKCDTSTNESV